MTTIHALHTTIQFPTEPGDDLLPDLFSCESLWPNLWPQMATWTRVDGRHPMLHPLIEYATDAFDTEGSFRLHYQRACTFHRHGNSFLAAQWINLSIQGMIVTVHRWMDVAAMLAMVERDAPDLAAMVHPLLQAVGTEQQRLLTLLAILQGVYFTYCQTQHILPTLLALPEEEMQEQEYDRHTLSAHDVGTLWIIGDEEGRR